MKNMRELLIETVTYDGGGVYPELHPDISGYGDDIRVEIVTHQDKTEKATTIQIGDNTFLPSQLEYVLKQAKEFDEKF
jgi:hypothetical protein